MVHIFEDMTNAFWKKLPLLDVDGWSLQGKLARARAGQAGSIWGWQMSCPTLQIPIAHHMNALYSSTTMDNDYLSKTHWSKNQDPDPKIGHFWTLIWGWQISCPTLQIPIAHHMNALYSSTTMDNDYLSKTHWSKNQDPGPDITSKFLNQIWTPICGWQMSCPTFQIPIAHHLTILVWNVSFATDGAGSFVSCQNQMPPCSLKSRPLGLVPVFQ